MAKVGVFGKWVTGIGDGPDVEAMERSADCGQATHRVHSQDKRGQVHAIEVTVYVWKVLILIDAAPKIPLAVKVGKITAHETHWTRALVMQERSNLAGHARLHKVVFERSFWAGTARW